MKYQIDETLFKKIDCEWKAYFLGFMYADGNINNNNVRIELQKKDAYILREFSKFIYGFSKVTKSKDAGQGNILGKICNIQELQKFGFTRKKMAEDLIKLGCFAKKSLILKFPTPDQVPLNLIGHFIRGYFDGDGCIKDYKYKRMQTVKIISSDDFCAGIKDFCESIGINGYTEKCGKVSNFYIENRPSLFKFYNLMYENATIFLKRKKKIFNKFYKNCFKSKVGNKSGNLGIYKKKNKRWEAYISLNGKYKHVGIFNSKKEAIEKRKEYLNQLGRIF